MLALSRTLDEDKEVGLGARIFYLIVLAGTWFCYAVDLEIEDVLKFESESSSITVWAASGAYIIFYLSETLRTLLLD